MNISSLTQLRLEACRFSKASYTVEFDGRLDDRMRRLHISTSYSVSLVGDELTDAAETFSPKVWRFLESELSRVVAEESDDLAKVTFLFDREAGFVVWGSKRLMDNLLLVRDIDSGEWFSVF